MANPYSNVDWNVVTRQFFAHQGQAAPAPASATPELPAHQFAAFLAMLNPNPNPDSNPELQPTADSDTRRRAALTFKTGGQPGGTAGRGTFNLQQTLELSDDDYELMLRTVRQTCIQCHFDMNLAITKQNQDKVKRAHNKLKKAVPGFNKFDDPSWPIDAFLLVVMKSSSQSAQRRQKNYEARLAAEAAPLPLANDNSDPAPAHDMTTEELEEVEASRVMGEDGNDEMDEDEDEEVAGDLPFIPPP
ncbi:hypothetical protein FRC06_009248, partial [Ceratobasidium sp. 370]